MTATVSNLDDLDPKTPGVSGGQVKKPKSVALIKSVVEFEEMGKNFDVPTGIFSSKVKTRNSSEPDEGLIRLDKNSNKGLGPLNRSKKEPLDSQSKKLGRDDESDGEPRQIGQVDSISNLESLDGLSMEPVE
jgi:hypothetical protein